MWKKAVVQDFPQKVKVEDVKTKLSCEDFLFKIHSIQFHSIRSIHSIRSFNLWFLAIINIRNTEVPSNFLWLPVPKESPFTWNQTDPEKLGDLLNPHFMDPKL